MRWLYRWFAVLLVGIPLALAPAVYLAIVQAPLVTAQLAFTPVHIERAKRLIDRNDPRTMTAEELRSIVVWQVAWIWQQAFSPAVSPEARRISCCRMVLPRCVLRSNCHPIR